MVVFNDPAELPDPALSAVRMGIELRDAIATLAEGWRAQGHALGCGIGIAQGSATIGTIGFPGRQDYGVIGPVNNLAARLCAQAQPRQVLVAADVFEAVQDVVSARALAPLVLKGFQQPVQAYDVIEMRRGQDTTGPQAAPAAAPLGVTD
jgi:class 3 adenylate cyclase